MSLRRMFLGSFLAITLIASSAPYSRAQASDRLLTTMTRNLDEGTDFGPIFAATDFSQFATEVANAYLEVQASNIPERSAAIADEIAARQPYLIGLQEVSVWRTGPLFGHADTVTYDALQSLLQALEARGQHYSVIKTVTEFEGEAPSALGIEVGFSDLDVVLARTDLSVSELQLSNVQGQHFVTNLVFPSPVLGIVTIPRGWISVDGKLRGKEFRFITTHLESFHPGVQAAQASELMLGPANTDLPVIICGDLNTEAPGGNPALNAAYQIVLSGGFSDIWSTLHPSDPGFTWPLHAEDPFTSSSTPSQRIDLVLSRAGRKGLGALATDLIGNLSSDLTQSGLWPSDHAGLLSVFTLEP
jgi:endonuclease/exonuclease/phosphatase family metal-dependent hydrolase